MFGRQSTAFADSRPTLSARMLIRMHKVESTQSSVFIAKFPQLVLRVEEVLYSTSRSQVFTVLRSMIRRSQILPMTE